MTIKPDRLDVYTDSAALWLDGRLRSLVSKVRELPGMRSVVTMQGCLGALDAVARILPTVAADFDGLRAAAEDGRLRAALGLRGAVRSRCVYMLAPFNLVVAGWGSKGPGAFMVCNHGRMRLSQGGGGPLRWKPWDMPWASVMPTVRLSKAMRDEPDGNMLAIMGRQRRHLEPSLLQPKGRRMVGGFVEHTAVTAAGIETRRFPAWEAQDVPGAMIGGGTAYRRAWARLIGFGLAAWLGGFAVTFAVEVAAILARSGR